MGPFSVDEFLRRHWQKRPLLIRRALPAGEFPLSPEQVCELASRDDVEARLVRQRAGRWSLRHGPFEKGGLPSLLARHWTVLVQGVDLHDDGIAAVRDRFRFVPDARLDDVMISVAGDAGGVGPHVDSYDVFLLQAWGHRRWRVGRCRDSTFVQGVPLKILARFEADREWLLEPGDMLYLPPGWAHEGTAEGPCMTASIGFRAPSRHEFLRAWLAEWADSPGGRDPRYGDASMRPIAAPARIPQRLADSLRGWALRAQPDRGALEEFIGRFLTEPQPAAWFEPPRRVVAQATFAERASRAGLRADRRTRLAYLGRRMFVNGELATATADRHVRRFADARWLAPEAARRACEDPQCCAMLWQWWQAGWIRLESQIP